VNSFFHIMHFLLVLNDFFKSKNFSFTPSLERGGVAVASDWKPSKRFPLLFAAPPHRAKATGVNEKEETKTSTAVLLTRFLLRVPRREHRGLAFRRQPRF